MRRPRVALRLSAPVASTWSIPRSNVARLLLTRAHRDDRPRFVQVPLDLRDPNGLAVLAMILCLDARHRLGRAGVRPLRRC